MEQPTALTPFNENAIRKVWHEEAWFFSVVDVVAVLSEAAIPRNYWSDLKRRDTQLHDVCVQLKMPANGLKKCKIQKCFRLKIF
jgi:DNA-damage-inducible protein D